MKKSKLFVSTFLILNFWLLALHSNAQSCFSPAANFLLNSYGKSVVSADFNKDGFADLATACNSVDILLGDGAGNFGFATSIATLNSSESIISADFNADGNADLAASDHSNMVWVFLGDGTGNFASPASYSVGTTPYGVCTADFNGDSKADLAVANFTTNNISILLGNGNGTFGSATNFAAGTYPVSLTSSDFNGDGFADLAAADNAGTSNNVLLLLGDGAGNFGAPAIFSATNNVRSITSTDFNGDGKADLAVTAGNGVNRFLGNGAGGFSAPTNFNLGTSPYELINADFNGDGKADLATANSNSDNVSVLIGNGVGGFSSLTNFSVGTEPYSVTSADLNGDGKTDLSTANFTGQNTSILLNLLPGPVSISGTTDICFGSNTTLTANGTDTYLWNTGLTTSSITVSPTNTTTYTVKGFATGCTAFKTDTVIVTILPLPTVIASATDTIVCAGNMVELTGAGAATYIWTGGVNDGVGFIPTSNSTYTVTGSDINNCSNTAIIAISVITPPTPAICMVTVDAASVNNIIYWDKTSYTNADSFIVYREVSTLIYKRIGAVSVDSLSEYVDTARSVGPANGNPNVGSYRYKLQLHDTCGNYGSLSPYHNTIYIIDAGSGQFTWSIPYSIEGSPNPVANYVLLCDTANVDVWTPVGTVSGTQSSATDPGFTNHATIANWRVKTVWSISCNPTRASVNTTRSNIKHTSMATGILSNTELNSAVIYPNPATDFVSVELSGSIQKANIRILNSIGQLVFEQPVVTAGNSKTIKQINTGSFAKGIYTIAIETNTSKTFKKLVIN